MTLLRHVGGSARHCCSLLLLGTLAGQSVAEELLSMGAEQKQLNFGVIGLEELGEGDYLAVELDGYDVTALTTRNAGELVLEMPTRLSGGRHPLMVLVFYANGNVDTLLEASVEVAEPGSAQASEPGDGAAEGAEAQRVDGSGSYAAAGSRDHALYALFSNNYRVDERNPASYPDRPRYASNGGLSYRGQGAGEYGRWQAELDALYDNNSLNNPNGYEWELPHYRLAASRGRGLNHQGLALGNYNVAREDLLFSAYQRRGAVVTLGDALEGPLQLDVFAVQSEPLTDYRHRLGFPGRSEERSAGGLLTFAPLPDDPQLLQLSAGFIDGETTDSSIGQWSPDQSVRYAGSSWNLGGDSRMGNNSLWLHADYASASFDSDGLGFGEGERRDQSHDLQAQLNSGSWFAAGPFDQWSLTLQRRQVGLDYFSLGNLYQPGDLLLDRINWQGYLGNLQMEAEWAQETNNLDGRAELADQVVQRRLFNLYYYPMVDAKALPWTLLGMPSLNAGFTETRRRQDRDDAEVVGFDVNDRTRESLFGVNFYHNRWNWSVQHSVQDTRDRSRPVEQQGFLVYEPPSDQRHRMTTLQLGYTPFDNLSLSTSWQWSKQQELDDDNIYRSTSRGLDMAWQIVPQRWRLNASYYRGRDRSHFGESGFLGDNQLQQTANLQLTWSTSQPKGLRPGVDWFLKSSYAKQSSELYDLGREDWQLLLGFDLRWDTHTY
jgi:hypothetical protein